MARSPELVKPLYLPTCSICKKSVAYIEEDRARGHRLIGNQVTVLQIARVKSDRKQAVVDVITKSDDGRVVDESNRFVYKAQGWNPTRVRLALTNTGSAWLLADIAVIGPAE
jgi:hypothetical protein